MKKERYEKPKSELEEFNTTDVISTSTTSGDDNDTPFPWG